MNIDKFRLLKDRRIVLGVCGSIAAYKAADLASILTQAGAQVRVVMTESARKIISEDVLATLSRNRVEGDLWEKSPDWKPKHISLAEFAEVLLVAPATANTIANFAHGIANDTLTCTYLASTAKVLMAPAMNVAMFEHPATQDNMQILKKRGVKFIEPSVGNLACGVCAKGKLADIEDILKALADEF